MARRLAGSGMKVAIIERKLFGGTCVNTGCTPTKSLVASAYAAHMVDRAAEFGVIIDGRAIVDMKRVKARMDANISMPEPNTNIQSQPPHQPPDTSFNEK